MAMSACNRRHEPSYKQHTAVDDARGVVFDVAVTTGAVSERGMLEAQVDAVRETTGRAIGTVTADAGYAYARVFGGLERSRIDPVIPTRRDPSRSRVPLRRFRYDARRRLVKCPHARILRPVRHLKRGQVFLSRVSDCARCPLKADCLPPASTRRWSSRMSQTVYSARRGRSLSTAASLSRVRAYTAQSPPPRTCPTVSAAWRAVSSERWTYLRVVAGWWCPSRRPIVGTVSPPSIATLA